MTETVASGSTTILGVTLSNDLIKGVLIGAVLGMIFKA